MHVMYGEEFNFQINSQHKAKQCTIYKMKNWHGILFVSLSSHDSFYCIAANYWGLSLSNKKFILNFFFFFGKIFFSINTKSTKNDQKLKENETSAVIYLSIYFFILYHTYPMTPAFFFFFLAKDGSLSLNFFLIERQRWSN